MPLQAAQGQATLLQALLEVLRYSGFLVLTSRNVKRFDYQ
jgi:hypothetical protein